MAHARTSALSCSNIVLICGLLVCVSGAVGKSKEESMMDKVESEIGRIALTLENLKNGEFNGVNSNGKNANLAAQDDHYLMLQKQKRGCGVNPEGDDGDFCTFQDPNEVALNPKAKSHRHRLERVNGHDDDTNGDDDESAATNGDDYRRRKHKRHGHHHRGYAVRRQHPKRKDVARKKVEHNVKGGHRFNKRSVLRRPEGDFREIPRINGKKGLLGAVAGAAGDVAGAALGLPPPGAAPPMGGGMPPGGMPPGMGMGGMNQQQGGWSAEERQIKHMIQMQMMMQAMRNPSPGGDSSSQNRANEEADNAYRQYLMAVNRAGSDLSMLKDQIHNMHRGIQRLESNLNTEKQSRRMDERIERDMLNNEGATIQQSSSVLNGIQNHPDAMLGNPMMGGMNPMMSGMPGMPGMMGPGAGLPMYAVIQAPGAAIPGSPGLAPAAPAAPGAAPAASGETPAPLPPAAPATTSMEELVQPVAQQYPVQYQYQYGQPAYAVPAQR